MTGVFVVLVAVVFFVVRLKLTTRTCPWMCTDTERFQAEGAVLLLCEIAKFLLHCLHVS